MAESTALPKESYYLKKVASELRNLANPDCELCPLHQDTDRVCIPVNMPTRRLTKDGQHLPILVVGEAPGGNEEQTGRLFSGNAGQLLDSLLEEVGIKREWLYVTNGVKCRPEQNRTPTAKEIKTCSATYLSQEIQAIQPKFGLILGNGGCQAVLGKKGITQLNGQVIERHGVTWVAAFHPAAVLRNPRYRKSLHGALLVFARLIRDEEGAPNTETVLVNDKDTLRQLVDELKVAQKAAIDVETWSSHPSVGRFKGGGLAWWAQDFTISTINFSFRPGYAYVLALDHLRSRWKDWRKVVEIIKPHMERVPHWIMHNGKFDSKCLEMIGIHIRHSSDTMGMEYARDENNLKGLGFLSQVYLAAPEYKELVDKTNMRSEDLDLMAEYGGKDGDYTLRLEPIIRRRLSEEPLALRLYDKLLHPADLVLTELELRGVPLDKEKLVARTIECEQNVYRTEQEIYALTGWEFNIGSPAQLADILFNRMGLPVIETTRTGKSSTREGVLIALKAFDDNGLIERILEYRKWSGYRSRYLGPWPSLADVDWRLHTHFKPYHTVTGRLSSENPNLQQVPRDHFIRGIVGGRPGWVILEADYSQAEMRIAAHYSQDKTMIRIFNTGRDIHMETAMGITGLSTDEVSSEQRKMAKAVNFGFLYGMGWYKFMDYAKENYELDVTEGEAKMARREFFAQFRSLPGWHERQRKKARRGGYVISAIGRKRHLHDIYSTNKEIKAEAERQAINSPVQSLASDMMLLAMVQLEKQLDPNECRMISTVHDSILFEVREDMVDKYAPIIRDAMENVPLEKEFECILTVPIVADIKYGSHWSEGAVEV
jgi:DNA polymerase-1